MIATEPTIPGIIAIMPAKDSTFFQALGNRIAQARKERGMTQQALAEALGIAQQTLGHYEVARAASPPTCSPGSPKPSTFRSTNCLWASPPFASPASVARHPGSNSNSTPSPACPRPSRRWSPS